jgi:quercetin dioxygenase-like cupin family protein
MIVTPSNDPRAQDPSNAPPRPTQQDPYFLPAGEGSRHEIFPGVEIRTTTVERMLLAIVRFEPGAVVEHHSHHYEQVGTLISGCLDFEIGGTTRRLSPGDAWRIPGNVPHRVVAVGGPAVAIDVFSPIREEYR